MISVGNADYMGEYKIHIEFIDGKQGEIAFFTLLVTFNSLNTG